MSIRSFFALKIFHRGGAPLLAILGNSVAGSGNSWKLRRYEGIEEAGSFRASVLLVVALSSSEDAPGFAE